MCGQRDVLDSDASKLNHILNHTTRTVTTRCMFLEDEECLEGRGNGSTNDNASHSAGVKDGPRRRIATFALATLDHIH